MGSAASITADSIENRLSNLNGTQIQGISEILNKGPSKNRSAVLSLLVELSRFEQNQAGIISSDFSFLPTLLAVLNGTAEEKLQSLTIFANVSELKDNRSIMLEPSFGLVDKLIATLRGVSTAECAAVFTTLLNLSSDKKCINVLLDAKYNLVPTIVEEFKPDNNEEDYVLASSLLLRFAELSCKALFDQDRYDLIFGFVISGLCRQVKYLSRSRHTLLELFYLLVTQTNRSAVDPKAVEGFALLVDMVANDVDDRNVLIMLKTMEYVVMKRSDEKCTIPPKQEELLKSLQTVAKSRNQDIYLRAMNIILQLADYPEHVSYMCESNIALVSFLVREISANAWKESGDEGLIAALMALISMSVPACNKHPMADPALNVVTCTKEVVMQNKGFVRLLGLKILMDLSESADNLDYMASPEMDLFLVLMEIVFQFDQEETESISCCLEIIQNMLPSQKNKSYVSSLQLGIMKLMMAVIDRDTGDPTRIALRIIYNITMDPDGVVFVAAALHLGLHEKLGVIIAKNSRSAPQSTLAWACLLVISKTAEHVEYLVEQVVFIELLVSTLTARDTASGETADEVPQVALDIILNLVLAVDNIPKVAASKGRMLWALGEVLKAKKLGYMDCLRIFSQMTKSNSVLEPLASPELGILHTLIMDLTNTAHPMITPEAREAILAIICSLTSSHYNIEHMLSTEENLFKVLLTIIHNDTSVREVVLALKSIQQFSVLTKNAILVASVQFGLMKRLLTIIRDQRDERSSAALSVLSILAVIPETIETMGSKEAGQIEMFTDILQSVNNDNVVVDVLKVLKSLSAHSTSNKLYMADPSHGLVSVVLKFLKGNNAEIKENGLKCLRNLSSTSMNQSLLAAPQLGLVDILIDLAKTETGDVKTVVLAVFRNLTHDKSVALNFATRETGVVALLIETLSQSYTSDTAVNALATLQNLSYHSENIDIMVCTSVGVVPTLLEVIRCNRVESKSLAFRVLKHLSASAKYGIDIEFVQSTLRVLFDIIKEGRDADVLQCMQILLVITKSGTMAVYLASDEVAFLQLLIDTVRLEHSEARSLALGCLTNLSRSEENIAKFASVELKLIPLMADVLRECLEKSTRSSDSRLRGDIRESLMIILHMVILDEVKIALVTSQEMGFLRILIDYLKLATMDENKALALHIFKSLTVLAKIKASFGSPESGLVTLLRDILLVNISITTTAESSEIVNQTLGVLQNLSSVKKNVPYMGDAELGLGQVLVMALKKPAGGPADRKNITALSILQNLSCADETLGYLSSDELDLVKLLLNMIIDSSASNEETMLASGILRNLSTSPANATHLCKPEFGLYDILARLLREGDAKKKLNSLVILQNITCLEQNILSLGRPESGLVPLLMAEVMNESDDDRQLVNTAIDVIRNLSSLPANIEYLISSPLKVLDSMVEVIQRDGNAETSVNALGALCNFADESLICEALLEKQVHSLAIAVLSKDADVPSSDEWGDEETMPINALIYLLNMSQWTECSSVFEEEGVITLLQRHLLAPANSESNVSDERRSRTRKAHVMRALLTVLFIVRDREDEFYWNVLSTSQLHPDSIITSLEAMMEGSSPEECDNIHMKMLVRACNCMSLNVKNLASHANPKMVGLYLSIIKAYRVGIQSPRGEELKIDLDCVDLAIQGLVILSFSFPDDGELGRELFIPDIQEELCPMLSSLSETFSRLGSKQFVMYLLYRLRGRDGIGYAKPFSSQKHVMLSYAATEKTAKNKLVSSLQSNLQALGYEVWMDTTGSLIAPAVSDESLENRVARIMAVKTSAVVIICFSKLYKQSLTNRMDVALIPESSGCRILFAQLDSDYGRDTSPDRVDGWLAALVSTHPSLPVQHLWLSSQVENVSNQIAEYIGDSTARRDALLNSSDIRGRFGAGAASVVPLEASVFGLSDDQVSKLTTAWDILQTSTNSVDHMMLTKYLDFIGVYDALDLRQCDEGDIAEITKLLKKIQRKVFSTCLAE